MRLIRPRLVWPSRKKPSYGTFTTLFGQMLSPRVVLQYLMAMRWLLVFVFGSGYLSTGAEEVDFARNIRPILSDRCFKCHGLDEESRKADLALHSFDLATKNGGIIPGDAKQSLIMERILSDDPDEMMPPPSANKQRLSPEENC